MFYNTPPPSTSENPPFLPRVGIVVNILTTSENFISSVTKGGIGDNTPYTSENFTIICYQTLVFTGKKHSIIQDPNRGLVITHSGWTDKPLTIAVLLIDPYKVYVTTIHITGTIQGLTIPTPPVITLPFHVTNGLYYWQHPHHQWYLYPPLLPRDGSVDTTDTTSDSFNLLCYQVLDCWQHPHYKW